MAFKAFLSLFCSHTISELVEFSRSHHWLDKDDTENALVLLNSFDSQTYIILRSERFAEYALTLHNSISAFRLIPFSGPTSSRGGPPLDPPLKILIQIYTSSNCYRFSYQGPKPR
jgi:hypothetical protein